MLALAITYILIIIVTAVVVPMVLKHFRVITPRLTPLPPSDKMDPDLDLITVIIPARNEEDNIERCIRGVLSQDYRPKFEVFVVDDNSDDLTATIAQRTIIEMMAKTDVQHHVRQANLIKLKEKPDGWTGKTYAVTKAMQRAEGRWILFVDADTHLEPSCLRAMYQYAKRERFHLVSLLPSLQCPTFWEKVIQPWGSLCYLLLMDWPEFMKPIALGPAMLARRDAYDMVGGHAAVRTSMIEDMDLSYHMAQHGFSVRVANAPDLADTRFFANIRASIVGWVRAFRMMIDIHDQPLRRLGVLAVVLLWGFVSYSVIAAGTAACTYGHTLWGSVFIGLGLIHEMTIVSFAVALFRDLKVPRWYIAFRGVAASVLLFVIWKVYRVYVTGAPISWRGRAYDASARRELL